MVEPDTQPTVLLTGASGYVGGRLCLAMVRRGVHLRCLARNVEFVAHRFGKAVQVFRGDVLDRSSLLDAMRGVDVAYYLVHSMGQGAEFAQQDRLGASNFASVAAESGVRRIIYLGALGEASHLSAHLASRQEVGRILRVCGIPTIEFRASIILGSGSLSFELIRSLVQKLPVMVTPRWVRNLAQPIAIEDVVDYLIAALDVSLTDSRIYEIGGPDRASYLDLMHELARQQGLRRLFVRVPVLTPYLSGLWLGLVAPMQARIGRKLIDSIRHETVVHDASALADFDIHPRGFVQAIRRALANEDQEFAQTRWSDAMSSMAYRQGWGGVKFGGRLVDCRSLRLPVPPQQAFATIARIGGRTGWYYGHWLWRCRGWIDRLCGGVGLRRGRRDPEHLAPGDAVDFWRVEQVEPGLLRLRAEMRVPGRAWLQFEVTACPGGSILCQTAIFDPAGIAGLAYWYALWPLHHFVFAGMLRGIAAATQAPASQVPPDAVHVAPNLP